jgi:8-oxo-dGTP pyrophosphatase MutT (NUDIX family)
VTIQFDLTGPVATPRDAATVILLRDGPTGLEIFFVKRRADVRFMGGAYVFPGGKLDEADADPDVPCDLDASAASARLGEPDGARARGLHVAAARECLEEAGVLLVREPVDAATVAALRRACDQDKQPLGPLLRARGLTLALGALVPLARWITPRGETRRFDARFFLAAAPPEAEAVHDAGETVASAWLSPREALARAHRQEIVLVPPTYRTVQLLTQQRDVATALAMAPPVVPTLEPVVQPGAQGAVLIALPGDPAHPAPAPVQARDGFLDPSPLVTRFVYDHDAWRPAEAPR